MKFKKILYLSVLTLVAGCQGMMPQEGAAPVNPGGDVTLSFSRTSTVWFAIVRNAQVYVDDLKVCVIPNSGNCTVNIPSGKHVLKIDSTFSGSFGVFSQSYQFDSGKTYRFVIAPNKTEMVANSLPFGVADATYYEANKGNASSNNGDFTMMPAD
ncbi:hypothetical protein [Polynucleobacter sp. AP-Kolm-20A-A1]|uniref:hypothetical protein n=1 Tax=Polynucleobacter sp. AP-Kolm-20A-A1 TaxID=2081041 RepID=UPI001BFD1F04|nr:hypothetical protein [Polynucleobacter sp. AP-Kolm-20A-A1]QWE20156.1 hypothetical protein C2745_07080 [Polynucleobacter sp. AP-Kolm-20A-A1]